VNPADEEMIFDYIRQRAAELGTTPQALHPLVLQLMTRHAYYRFCAPPPEWKTKDGISTFELGYYRITVIYWSRRQTPDVPAGWQWSIHRNGAPAVFGAGLKTEDIARTHAEIALMDGQTGVFPHPKAITEMIPDLKIFSYLEEVFTDNGTYEEAVRPSVAAIENLLAVITSPGVPQDDIQAAADSFRHFFAENIPTPNIAAGFTCSEIEILAEVIAVLGEPDTAARWLNAHAEGDEPDDEHYLGDGKEQE
jgi:hypothetical protein